MHDAGGEVEEEGEAKEEKETADKEQTAPSPVNGFDEAVDDLGGYSMPG